MAVAAKIKDMMQRSSWIRKMFETGTELKAKHGADRVCDFSLGNPVIEPPPEFSRAVIEIVSDSTPLKHAYMPNAGYPGVRKKIAEHVSQEQGAQLTAEHVIMTCGAGGAMNVALKTISNPGSKVLASTPCFMEYAFYTGNHGGELQLVPSSDDFDLDIEALESRIDGQTVAVIINSPTNPCGRIYPRSTLEALAAMLEAKSRAVGHAVYLIADEQYRKIVYDGEVVPSVLSAYRNSIIATSYSKELSIPGERIGYLAVHPEAEDVSDLLNGMVLCNRILGYVNAPALMQRVVERLIGRTADLSAYQRKRDALCSGLSDIGYEFRKPQGTFYLFPKSPVEDDTELVAALQEQLILAVPGRGFGCPGYFRIAFCVDDTVIARSMDGFAKAYRRCVG